LITHFQFLVDILFLGNLPSQLPHTLFGTIINFDRVCIQTSREKKPCVKLLPVMIYVGISTTKKLEKYGVYTIGDIAKLSPSLMKQWLGYQWPCSLELRLRPRQLPGDAQGV